MIYLKMYKNTLVWEEEDIRERSNSHQPGRNLLTLLSFSAKSFSCPTVFLIVTHSQNQFIFHS